MTVKKKTADKAVVREAKTGRFVRSSTGKALTSSSGIFKIRGIGESKREGGYSTRKHDLDR